MKRGMDFKAGSIVTYIVTKKGESISDKAMVADFVEEGDYDAEYYIGNQVLPSILRIMEALGYSEDELKGLGKQMTLGGF
jgi:DNA polymerase I